MSYKLSASYGETLLEEAIASSQSILNEIKNQKEDY